MLMIFKLEYITLLITFPFARDNIHTKLINSIYVHVYELLSEIEFNPVLLHLKGGASLYHSSIDKILCSNDLDKGLDYPYIELFLNDKKIDISQMPESICCTFVKPDVEFTCTQNLFFYKEKKLLLKQYKETPPCKLDKLKITVSGILQYDEV